MISSLFYRLAYRSGTPRWDSPEPQPELAELARGRPPGRVLDLGCGTGSDVLYLASLGWEAIGVDFAPRAIEIARSRAAASGSSAAFIVGDVTRLREAGVDGRFDLVLDVGCYHGIPAGRRDAYRAGVAAVTEPGGDLYLAGISDPPAAWRMLGAPGLGADDVRHRFGADFDLVGEQTTGPVGRAGNFTVYHLVRKPAAAAARTGLFSGRAVEALPDQVGVASVPRVLHHVRHHRTSPCGSRPPRPGSRTAPPSTPRASAVGRRRRAPRFVRLKIRMSARGIRRASSTTGTAGSGDSPRVSPPRSPAVRARSCPGSSRCSRAPRRRGC